MTDLTAAADLLTRLNRWRKGGRGEMPDPRKITAAIDTAILALKIANAAKEWRDAEQAKAQAKRRFADAVAACVNHPASRRETEKEYAEGASHANVTVWLIVRVRTDYPYEHEWVYADGSANGLGRGAKFWIDNRAATSAQIADFFRQQHALLKLARTLKSKGMAAEYADAAARYNALTSAWGF